MNDFDRDGGRQTSETTFEWECGCIAHSFEGEMTVKACCIEHDDALGDFVEEIASEMNPAPVVETKYV